MTLDKLLLQVRRIAEHRELGAEKKIRAAYKQCLKELKQFIGYEYATLAEDGKLTYDILAKKQAQARFLEEVQQNIDAIAPEIRSEMTQLISSVYNLSYNGMIEAASSIVPGEVSSALKGLSYVQPMQIKSGIDNTLINKIMLNDVLEKNRKGVIYELKQAVNIGLTNGETVDMMSKRISKVLDGDYKKSVRVARTEVHRVREAGLNEGARDFDAQLKDAGVDMRMAKIWRTMKDNRVRPNVVRKSKKGTITKMGHGANHIQMEGQTVLADEQFELSDGNMTDAPGQSGIASQDINCRCFVRYKLVSEEEYMQLTGKNFEGKAFTNGANRDKIFNNAEVDDFVTAVQAAKNAQKPNNAWRVTAMSKEEFKAEHPNAICHITQAGGVAAVTTDGDIVSVCAMPGDTVKGKSLLAKAVAAGGNKLDSYEGNHSFYIKCGFEPVSWCKWDGEYAPEGWTLGRDKPEDIIFYKYTGGRSKYIIPEDFKNAVAASPDYNKAQKLRDDSI